MKKQYYLLAILLGQDYNKTIDCREFNNQII